MKLSITGHRPEGLKSLKETEEDIRISLIELKPELIYIGMASGVDLMAGSIALDLNIPYIATKPWAGHVSRIAERDTYNLLIEKALEVINVNASLKYPGIYSYHNRNVYMVDNSDALLAVWSGKKTGGTAECVKYAKRKEKNIYQLNPLDRSRGWVELVNRKTGLKKILKEPDMLF